MVNQGRRVVLWSVSFKCTILRGDWPSIPDLPDGWDFGYQEYGFGVDAGQFERGYYCYDDKIVEREAMERLCEAYMQRLETEGYVENYQVHVRN